MIMLFNMAMLIAIIFIVYWFWLYRNNKVDVVNEGGVIDIIVDNGVYSPALIKTSLAIPLRLRFTRRIDNPCAATLVFSELNQSASLPLNTPVLVDVHLEHMGEFEFGCEMGMYRGRIIVV